MANAVLEEHLQPASCEHHPSTNDLWIKVKKKGWEEEEEEQQEREERERERERERFFFLFIFIPLPSKIFTFDYRAFENVWVMKLHSSPSQHLYY